jgi:hypothetical protein
MQAAALTTLLLASALACACGMPAGNSAPRASADPLAACSQFGCDQQHTGHTALIGPSPDLPPKPLPGFASQMPDVGLSPIFGPYGDLFVANQFDLLCRMDRLSGNVSRYGIECAAAACHKLSGALTHTHTHTHSRTHTRMSGMASWGSLPTCPCL